MQNNHAAPSGETEADMYSRHGTRSRHISIPHNYSGNAFSDEGLPKTLDEPDGGQDETDITVPADTERAEVSQAASQKSFLPISIKNEELIILGIILLIFQSEKGNEAIPILLALLFLGGDSNR